ncbi:MAG TPA: SsrA-binding protein, partial [Candidatus Kapabacteria bacterium]|nr:SsrA-binding protein [Candidatus Kapabacteria bacterium]
KSFDGELWLENVHISTYKEGTTFNHEPLRRRKLLLHKKELSKLAPKLATKGITMIPLSIYFKGNKVKVLLGIARGKKSHDKRDAIKERDIKREMDRE